MVAELTLDIVERDHWQQGQYRERPYELVSHIRTSSGRPMGAIQEDTALMLLRELRAQMLDGMIDAGWQEVATTRGGRPIYQYRPAPRISSSPAAIAEVATIFGDHADDLEDQTDQHPSKIYKVYGTARSKESGQAYTRRVTAKTVTFSCAICGAPVVMECYPGQHPKYCGSEECRREAVHLRVEKHRARKQSHE
ncbi:MAG TPA: hypothetical protein VF443_13075 [Nitrospira sp.]